MINEVFMQRCFDLAQMGEGNVSPNPMVGAVLVYENRIIGEGYHKAYGLTHAEPNAINSVEDKNLLKHSTLYVSLEPCSHYGKTPPCSDLIIENEIKRVVISNKDPNPKVFGGGIKKLRDAGIEVIDNFLEERGKDINKRFFCFHNNKRPYIILKWAETKNGFMDIDRAIGEKEKYWITNDALKLWVHKQRVAEDCILVGANTIINDNPQLNVRYFNGKNPLRLTIDKNLSIPKNRLFFDNSQNTIIFNGIEDIQNQNTNYIKIDFEKDVLEQVLQYLYSINKTSLIVEGGRYTLESFIRANLWDEANILVGNKFFDKGLFSPKELIEDRFRDNISVGDNAILRYS